MRIFQMSRAAQGYALGTLILVCALAALLVGRASSQSPPPPAQEVGRFQIVSAGAALNPYIYFVDTKTGRCWVTNSPVAGQKKENWVPVPVPVSAAGG